jgi:hypothetical protein
MWGLRRNDGRWYTWDCTWSRDLSNVWTTRPDVAIASEKIFAAQGIIARASELI